MAVTIPAEYLGYDYGFSGVDDPTPAANTVVQPSQPAISEEIVDSLNEKLDNIYSELAVISGKVGSTNTGGAKATEYADNIRTLEAIIIPLLNNLLKTADKDYIYWPDRAATIEAQLAKVLSITRG